MKMNHFRVKLEMCKQSIDFDISICGDESHNSNYYWNFYVLYQVANNEINVSDICFQTI